MAFNEGQFVHEEFAHDQSQIRAESIAGEDFLGEAVLEKVVGEVVEFVEVLCVVLVEGFIGVAVSEAEAFEADAEDVVLECDEESVGGGLHVEN